MRPHGNEHLRSCSFDFSAAVIVIMLDSRFVSFCSLLIFARSSLASALSFSAYCSNVTNLSRQRSAIFSSMRLKRCSGVPIACPARRSLENTSGTARAGALSCASMTAAVRIRSE